MGFLEWLGISPRDDPELPKIGNHYGIFRMAGDQPQG